MFCDSEIFRKVLTKTIVRWAEETHFESPLLVREMFGYVCYSKVIYVIWGC